MDDLRDKIAAEIDSQHAETFQAVRDTLAMRAEAAIQTWRNEQIELRIKALRSK